MPLPLNLSLANALARHAVALTKLLASLRRLRMATLLPFSAGTALFRFSAQ